MYHCLITFIFILIVLLVRLSDHSSPSAEISGYVLSDSTTIEGATVRLRATAISDITDSSGYFIFKGIEGDDSLTITAWQDGYCISGILAKAGQGEVIIELDRYIDLDNQAYDWLHPEPASDTETRCINCHSESIFSQWKNNLHSQAATSPFVLTMYNGTDVDGNPKVSPGFKLDSLGSDGSCANCHAPTAALKNGSWTTDLNLLDDIDSKGVHCDFCHKIIDAKADPYGSSPGFMSIELRRPDPTRQLFLGSFYDVPGNDSYAPIFESNRLCAPCHQFYNNNIPIYSSYPEWLSSSYARNGIECQDCHMKPDGVTTNIAPDKGGVERDPGSIPSHNQMGENDSIFIAETFHMSVTPVFYDQELVVSVDILNEKAGHHFPTGNPMRNVILVIQAFDSKGNALPYLGAEFVPEWGGIGTNHNDYGGLQGKGFAKILKDFSGNSPAPQWRTVYIDQDTLIPANRTDHSQYKFQFADEEDLSISASLIYRKGFKQWADTKGWDKNDLIIASDTIRIKSTRNY